MLHRFPKVRRWEETDDVFTEALTKLHRSLSSVQPTSAKKFYGLAATQIRRVLIDMARHYGGPEGLGANYETATYDSDGGAPRYEQSDRSGEPASLMEWTEFHEQVESLPQEEKEIFDLLWYEGLNQEEAAHALGVTDRTIRRRWQRARFCLQKMRIGEPLPE
jgi:RNA polymerase sigma-70 factor (ECF subfamily)